MIDMYGQPTHSEYYNYSRDHAYDALIHLHDFVSSVVSYGKIAPFADFACDDGIEKHHGCKWKHIKDYKLCCFLNFHVLKVLLFVFVPFSNAIAFSV